MVLREVNCYLDMELCVEDKVTDQLDEFSNSSNSSLNVNGGLLLVKHGTKNVNDCGLPEVDFCLVETTLMRKSKIDDARMMSLNVEGLKKVNAMEGVFVDPSDASLSMLALEISRLQLIGVLVVNA
ncbi:hypothetical protein V6N12_035568 [Hibiscus sabdariffa]|uniref:Uncharacterized protein n=1 Tax=Hibiscus sabdariffa TaxID=183260 RepID=A0ABR2ENH9_9ROSI